jgi:hypothetical protein
VLDTSDRSVVGFTLAEGTATDRAELFNCIILEELDSGCWILDKMEFCCCGIVDELIMDDICEDWGSLMGCWDAVELAASVFLRLDNVIIEDCCVVE